MGTKMLVTVSAILALLTASPIGAFVQLMGNDDIYCDSEGAYCQSDSSCCAGLECVPRFSRVGSGSGVCQRRSGERSEVADSSLSSAAAYPRFRQASSSGSSSSSSSSAGYSCQSNSDCPPGRCCVRRSLGVRGASVSACSTDCSESEISSILGNYYNRFYRRALRADKHRQQQQQAKEGKKEHHYGKAEGAEGTKHGKPAA